LSGIKTVEACNLAHLAGPGVFASASSSCAKATLLATAKISTEKMNLYMIILSFIEYENGY
jgi:hypothetical protein